LTKLKDNARCHVCTVCMLLVVLLEESMSSLTTSKCQVLCWCRLGWILGSEQLAL